MCVRVGRLWHTQCANSRSISCPTQIHDNDIPNLGRKSWGGGQSSWVLRSPEVLAGPEAPAPPSRSGGSLVGRLAWVVSRRVAQSRVKGMVQFPVAARGWRQHLRLWAGGGLCERLMGSIRNAGIGGGGGSLCVGVQRNERSASSASPSHPFREPTWFAQPCARQRRILCGGRGGGHVSAALFCLRSLAAQTTLRARLADCGETYRRVGRGGVCSVLEARAASHMFNISPGHCWNVVPGYPCAEICRRRRLHRSISTL